MGNKNITQEKTMAFAIRIVNLYKFLIKNKREFVLSKQMLRSGTSVGAMIREAVYAESKADFIHKYSIAQKESNETIYWLELLNKTDFLTNSQFESMEKDAIEILKLVTSIITTTKKSIKNTN